MSASQILCAAHYRTGQRFAFYLRGGRLVERHPTRRQADLLFGPGFFDLQCNGFAHVDFNHPRFTSERGAEAIRALWRHGCTEVLPTIITHEPTRLEHALRTLEQMRNLPGIRASVPGYHLEGPFISPVEGARGAHPLASVSPVRLRLWSRLQQAASGRIVMVTLAPELTGALPFIRRLRAAGVLPALGHTLASFSTVCRAAEAGALLSTHLGNGCPPTVPRHDNPIFAQLGCDALSATIISDGIHLPAEVLRTLVRAKGLERIVIVSDAMAAAGASPGRYTLGDLTLEVKEDGIVRSPGSSILAGSSLTMDRAVPNYAAMARIPLADAWEAGSLRPWKLLQRANPRRKPPRPRGLILVREGAEKLEVQVTLRGRQVLWSAA